MKKKIYNSPVAEFVELDVNIRIAENTSPFKPGEGGDFGDDEEQCADEYVAGSWENMWGNMQ